MPNQDQMMSVVRWVLTIAGTALGLSNYAWWAPVSGAILALAPVIWGLFAHTQTATVMSAAAIPGVQVAVSRMADSSMQKLANDPTVPDVVPVSAIK